MAGADARDENLRELEQKIATLENKRKQFVQKRSQTARWRLFEIDQELDIYKYEHSSITTTVWRQRQNLDNLFDFIDEVDPSSSGVELPLLDDADDTDDAEHLAIFDPDRLAIDRPDPMAETEGAFYKRVEAAAHEAWDVACTDLELRGDVIPRRDFPDLERHCEWTVRRYVLDERASNIAANSGATVNAVDVAVSRTATLLGLPRLPRRKR